MAQYTITNRREEIPFEHLKHPIDRVVQNAKNLLMTQEGEVPYDRLRGLDPAILHLPMDEMREALEEEIIRVMLWEPYVTVVSATAEMIHAKDETDQDVLITVVIDVKIPE
jgi:hypothetical protein